jgi:hypothetical protein
MSGQMFKIINKNIQAYTLPAIVPAVWPVKSNDYRAISGDNSCPLQTKQRDRFWIILLDMLGFEAGACTAVS